ncbi:MAG: hypothetical protein A2Y89_00775 [Chloroflexi bacterium RBG_13_51_18]|nr:MAG: hypothetical protein A2Y89_00775 [Chloroflexi bacterium RBG_13_51_18]
MLPLFITAYIQLGISSAGKVFTELAPGATSRRIFGYHKLGLAVAAKVFLPGFHRSITGSYSHRTKLDARSALFTKVRPGSKWVIHMAVFSPSNKALGPSFPEFGAGTHAAPAENTIFITEGIPYIFYSTAYGNVLNSA